MGLLTPMGISAPGFATEEPNLGIGGLFVVWTRVGAAGLSLDVGMGGGGLLPNVWCCLVCDWFRAAIRSWREVNWGSSTSAMARECAFDADIHDSRCVVEVVRRRIL